MHTQKNKHQYEKKDSRKALWRMCDYNREEFSNELWYYINSESQKYTAMITKKKAIDTISNAYRVYKFIQTINNRINKKNSVSKSKHYVEKKAIDTITNAYSVSKSKHYVEKKSN